MEIKCENCDRWVTQKIRLYDDGTQIIDFQADNGKGHCSWLDMETNSSFYCAEFLDATGDHIARQHINGSPWQHFEMIACPDCVSKADHRGVCGRCQGTQLVRKYADGYVGEERTRRHPNEPERPAMVDPGTILAPMEKPSLIQEQ